MRKLLLLLALISPLIPLEAQSGSATEIRHGATNPATCNPAQGWLFWNTTTSSMQTCTATNTWSAIGGSFNSPMTTLGDLIYENATPAAARLAGCTITTSVPCTLTSTPTSGPTAAAPIWNVAGVPTNPQTGTTYTYLATDRSAYVSFSNAASIAVTLPQAGSSGFGSNFVNVSCDIGAGTATITPATSTISYSTGSLYTSAASSMSLTTGQCAWLYSDNTNYFAIKFSSTSPAGNTFYATTSCGGLSNCVTWVDDDSTNNCGAATTTWIASINAYSGPGQVQVWIQGSGTGKAFKFTSCALTFTGAQGASVHLWATIDCAQSTDNCLQLGATGQSSTVATETYFVDGEGVLFGGAGLTTAGIHVEPYVNNFFIHGIKFGGPQGGTTNGGFGANNATLGSCTNYSIYVDAPINSGTISEILDGVSSSSSTSGGCGIANPSGATTGNNTIYINNNVIASLGFAGGVGACGSVGVVDGGSYGAVSSNNIYGFGADIRIQGVGHRITNNQLDSANCANHSINAAIQIGATGSSTAVGPVLIDGNVAQVTSGHTTYLISQAGDSTANLNAATIEGNMDAVGPNGAFTPGPLINSSVTQCATAATVTGQCVIVGNQNFYLQTVSGFAMPNAPGEMFAGCAPTSCVAQSANASAATVFTVPANFAGTMQVGCHVVVTQQATTSATVPSCVISWTDNTTSSVSSVTLAPISSGGTNPATGDYLMQMVMIQPKAGTAITLATTNYASSGATAMNYIDAMRTSLY